MAEPCFDNLLKVLDRKQPDRPTLFEFFLNDPLYEKLAGFAAPEDAMDLAGRNRFLIAAFRAAGYDYATVHGSTFGFQAGEFAREQTISLNEGSMVRDRAGFEAYAWEDPGACDYSSLDPANVDVPDGMKLVVCGPGGVLENVIRLAGYETLCYLLLDDPKLGGDLFDAVGSRLVKHYEIVGRYDTVGAMISNDDWGYKTQTMLALDQMREYVFPWHRKIVAAIHGAGKPAILHSCGNAAEIWEDIIADIKYDGKHSYEDAIAPVEEEYERWGSRIAILGGIDVDFVIRSDPEAVYQRSKAMLERAAGRGSFALGTGNSVPEYVPHEGYFAMTRAAVETRA